MAAQDFLFRARRNASLVAFNAALPSNFKLIPKPETEWLELPGVNLDPIVNLELAPGVLSPDLHYNLRVTDAWSGWAGLFIELGDPDYDDPDADPPIVGEPKLNNSKLKRWFKNNGVERLDNSSEHPRSGRADMRWFRWTDGTEWLDITIDIPELRRRVWM